MVWELQILSDDHLTPQDTEEMALIGDPICTSTLSNHWRGPFRWISTQQGVLVTSWRWYSAPQPFTNDILKEIIDWLETATQLYKVFFGPQLNYIQAVVTICCPGYGCMQCQQDNTSNLWVMYIPIYVNKNLHVLFHKLLSFICLEWFFISYYLI